MTWLLCDNKRVNLNISFVRELKLIFLLHEKVILPQNSFFFSNKEDLVTHGKAKSKQENDTTYNSCTFPTTSMLGHLDLVKEIIKHKSNFVEYVKKLNQFGYNPMYFATANGHVKIVKMLL